MACCAPGSAGLALRVTELGVPLRSSPPLPDRRPHLASPTPQVEDRPVVKERVEMIKEHRPVEKEFVVRRRLGGNKQGGRRAGVYTCS